MGLHLGEKHLTPVLHLLAYALLQTLQRFRVKKQLFSLRERAPKAIRQNFLANTVARFSADSEFRAVRLQPATPPLDADCHYLSNQPDVGRHTGLLGQW